MNLTRISYDVFKCFARYGCQTDRYVIKDLSLVDNSSEASLKIHRGER